MLRKIFWLRWVVVLAMLLGSGCVTMDQLTGTMFLMSTDREAELGKEIRAEIEKQYPVDRSNPEAIAYIESLGETLAAAAPAFPIPFRFQIVDLDEVNAFAIPGGGIYVMRGLLRTVQSEDELAAVMAHEIGHSVSRHSAKSISRSQFYGLIAGLAVGDESGQLAQVAASIVQSGMLLRNSRQAEYEADAIAIQAANRAGFDPAGMPRFLRRISGSEQSGALAGILQYASTHPISSERIAAADGQIRQLGSARASGRPDSSAFRRLKARYPAAAPGEAGR